MSQYELVERLPMLEEYRRLCEAVGWGDVMNFEAARTAIPNSLYGVVVMHDGGAVGMGRIVGDGAIFFYIQDVAVLPEHQGQGVGRLILDALTRYLEQHAPDKAFVGLFADDDTPPFYERYGFATHPMMTGMFRVIRREQG